MISRPNTSLYTPLGHTRTPWHKSRRVRIAGLALFLVANLALLSSWLTPRHTSDENVVDVARVLQSQVYVPIAPSTPLLPRARRHVPTDDCLELSLAQGEMCDARGYGIPENFQLDFVWSWVNSTDPIWRRTRAQAEARRLGVLDDAEVDYGAPISRFDNYDELKYSMRAALKSWGKYARRFHLIAADFQLPAEYVLPSNATSTQRDAWRLGQVPAWLAHPCEHDSCTPEQRRHWVPAQPAEPHWGKGVELAVHHHATYFDPYVGTSFSSFGIESQIPNLRGVSDIIVYLNDDMYFMREMAPSDYWSPAYGLTLRPQGWIPVPPTPEPAPIRGEWQPLRQTNTWLSRRFGNGTRPYLSHQPKVGSLSLWREFSTMFAAQFRRTRLRQFREVYFEDDAVEDEEINEELPYPFNLDPELNTEGRGKGTLEKGDIHTVFGIGHFVMERHRETLLWSFIVARLPSAAPPAVTFDGATAWKELLKGGTEEHGIIRVKQWNEERGGDGMRLTRRGERMGDTLLKAGFEKPKSTGYGFVSGDGYDFIDWRDEFKAEDKELLKEGEMCLIRREECFPSNITSPSDVFTNVAFAHPRCGDCIIHALVRASGPLGLSAFLPSPERTVRVPRGQLSKTLPTAQDWRGTDFSLEAVMGAGIPDTLLEDGEQPILVEEISARKWVLRVLDRYRFVIGNTPFKFRFMRSSDEAAAVTREVDESDAATICLNDDIEDPGVSTDPKPFLGIFGKTPVAEGDKVRRILHEWQTRRWPDAASWEQR
ncbi:hypothetical protein EXIGLDRAFT_737093 [Exidia glandulosa HHB12029]|uniref:Stealth protein CR1 conserved region 1 domain-containing protein n=1 Tax=Exidia glandulosa HHB12029 TaxID=1314781 RepID=A0A165J4W0_EXIGL|nr:hypothetical protein EXIGLDRAFT_737093 [Exidia glandulosa HHB12029]